MTGLPSVSPLRAWTFLLQGLQVAMEKALAERLQPHCRAEFSLLSFQSYCILSIACLSRTRSPLKASSCSNGLNFCIPNHLLTDWEMDSKCQSKTKLLLQRTQVQLSTPTKWLTNICNSSPREPNAVFWPPKALGLYEVHRHTSGQNTHIHKKKEKKKLNNQTLKKNDSRINIKII